MKRQVVTWTVLLAVGAFGCESGSGGDATERFEERQTVLVKQPGTTQVSVRLTVSVDRKGQMEILDAVELPGFLKLEKDMDRNFVYEARDAAGVVAVQAVGVEFERHAVGGGEHGDPQEIESQTFHVDLPGLTLEKARGVSLRLSEITAKHQERTASLQTMDRLAQQGKVRAFGEIKAARLATFVQTRGWRALPKAIKTQDQ